MADFGVENKDVLLALAIASGASASAAARQLEIPLRTVQRRTAEPDFRKLVSDIRDEMLTSALGRMVDNMTRASDAIAGLLDAPDPAIRLRAARAMLTLGLRLHDAVDVKVHIREIEDELARQKGYVQ